MPAELSDQQRAILRELESRGGRTDEPNELRAVVLGIEPGIPVSEAQRCGYARSLRRLDDRGLIVRGEGGAVSLVGVENKTKQDICPDNDRSSILPAALENLRKPNIAEEIARPIEPDSAAPPAVRSSWTCQKCGDTRRWMSQRGGWYCRGCRPPIGEIVLQSVDHRIR